MKNLRVSGAIFIALFLLLNLAVPAGASITPDHLEATLAPGESITETKTVHIEEVPPLADVVFAFDLTSSMREILDVAKGNAANIMNTLNEIPEVDINYGLMSYMDYPHYYDCPCGYSAEYGRLVPIDVCNDYAYRLDQPVTADTVAVSNAITALKKGCGGDGPEDYARIMYESYADPAVSWRAGAKRILVNFADNVPHDCNLNEGLTSGNWTTGGDPGRDEIMGSADDLDLQTVLADMDAHGVTLLECHTTTDYDSYWTYWTGITGGGLYITSSSTLVDDVVAAVNATLMVPMAMGVHLEASPGYEAWVSTDPASYDEVVRCEEDVNFEVTISVPEGTPEGTYMFTISVVDEDGVNYGEQTVVITVPPVITMPPRSPEELCSRSLGFYKNHPCIVDRLLPQSVGEQNFTTVDGVMELLWSQPRGDHKLILERAVLVAKLNVEMFGIGYCDLLGIGESVNEIITQSEEMLMNPEATKNEISAKCELLDQINNYGTDVPLPEGIEEECPPGGGHGPP